MHGLLVLCVLSLKASYRQVLLTNSLLDDYFRWVPPPYTKIKHERVCMTKEDFHEVYDLSLDGADNPQLMDVSEKDWLSVFTVLRKTGQKVKLRTIRPEFYNKFMMLYQMVYQEAPVNGECAAWFAKAFAFENCQRAELALDRSIYQVAWAVVAETSISRVGAHKQGISNKVARVSTHITEGETLSMPKFEGASSKAIADTVKGRHVELAQAMLFDVQTRIRDVEIEIGDISKKMQQAQVDKKVYSTADTFLQQLRDARQELHTLEASGDVPLERQMKLQAIINANVQVLSMLGVSECAAINEDAVTALQVISTTLISFSYFTSDAFEYCLLIL